MAIQGEKPSGAGSSAHPAVDELERFLRGKLPREEIRAVVRHLLTGCGKCLQVTRPLWRLGNPPRARRSGESELLEGGTSSMTAIEAAQAQLREIIRSLEAGKLRLLDVLETLPLSPAETDRLLDVEPADPGTAIRTVILCVLKDSLDPAIGDLRDVAEISASGPEERAG